jgi:hypothetical protein
MWLNGTHTFYKQIEATEASPSDNVQQFLVPITHEIISC